MLEVYRDGWRVVQHVGEPDRPKGVILRFGLHEQEPCNRSASVQEDSGTSSLTTHESF